MRVAGRAPGHAAWHAQTQCSKTPVLVSAGAHRPRLPLASKQPLICKAASEPSTSGQDDAWWDKINRKTGIRGPDELPGPDPSEKYGLLGKTGYQMWERIKKEDRQRAWDSMRASALERMQNGELPSWFNPEWLTMEEEPINRMYREAGVPEYQSDPADVVLDGSGGGPGSWNRGGRGGGWNWWWNEEDPYWPLGNWGDHPMRWWTFAFAAFLALNGLISFLWSGNGAVLFGTFFPASILAVSAMAMSDMQQWWYGEFGVKMAWATCALVALQDYFYGPHTKRMDLDLSKCNRPRLSFKSALAATMCVFYMWTGMSGLEDVALPMNPGGVYKVEDPVLKYKVWQRWGYGDVPA